MENQLREVAARIKELREISGFTVEQMAEKTEVSVEEYRILEQGVKDFGFTFIYKCAAAFGVEIKDLLEGRKDHQTRRADHGHRLQSLPCGNGKLQGRPL